jgi:hypothetical protein
MKIIVRCCGERTEKKCIELAKKQGTVHIVKASPFGETLRQSYKLALEIRQEWIPMIDADVLLSPGVLKKAILHIRKVKKQIFCWDGHTKDKIMIRNRRAGIHIYKTDLIPYAMKFIDDKQLKPESHVRREMQKMGLITYTSKFLFGKHDYEQYYHDLWRKAFSQSQKLAGMIRRSKIVKRWKLLRMRDDDFKVILEAHRQGRMFKGKIQIDSRLNYGARAGIKRLGLREKGRLR